MDDQNRAMKRKTPDSVSHMQYSRVPSRTSSYHAGSVSLGILKSGFTLIELLVVIAVIGILATIVMLTLDPLEQFSRAKDSKRIANGYEIASAMIRFNLAKATYPPDDATWQQVLVDARELPGIVSAVSGGTECTPNRIGNYCYSFDGTYAVMFTRLQSKMNTAGNCPGGQNAYYVWHSREGQTKIECQLPGSEPTP